MAQDEINMEEVPPTTPPDQMALMMNELRGLLTQQKEDRKIIESFMSQHMGERSKQLSTIEDRQTPTPPPTQPESVDPDFMKKMAHFQKFAPPSFEGAKTPLEAEKWLNKLEKVLITTQCEEQYKVFFMEFLLEGDAESWWSMEKRRLGVGQVNWSIFKKEFMGKYFSRVTCEQQEQNFVIPETTRTYGYPV